MRILHTISSLDPRAGGPPAALVGLATAQRKLGHKVSIVATYQRGADLCHVDALHQAGVDVSLAGPTHTPLGLHPRLARIVQNATDRAEVVHIHGLWEQVQYVAATSCQKSGKAYVVRPAGMLGVWSLQQSRLKKRLYMALRLRSMLDRAAAVHYTAELERDEAASLDFRAPAIIEPNGLDLAPFDAMPPATAFRQRFPVLGDRPYVLFLSRLHAKKGLDLLLPAFAKAAPPEFSLVLAGPGEAAYVATVRAEISVLGLNDRVILPGMLTRDTKFAALAGATLFTLPSHQENFGIAIVEALAAGTPVLISDQVNIYREIEAAGVGQAVPPEVGPVATALREWLTDPERRQLAAERARPFVRERYDWDTIAHRWVEHYERISAAG